jgi:hypothetical protein
LADPFDIRYREFMGLPPEPTFTIGSPPPNPWARISEIAACVGVGPNRAGDPPSLLAQGADGQMYDIMKVVVAVLDKLATASK